MREAMRVVPANEADWDDLQAVFGRRGEAAGCQCQWFFAPGAEFSAMSREEKAERFRRQTACGHPGAPRTSGLVAYLDGEPVGWCAVEPRTAYRRLARMRVPWAGRQEDATDDGVWAIVCFVVRTEFQRRGVASVLARAAVEHARSRGAHAVEGYPRQLAPGKQQTWGELFVGTPEIFAAAGLHEVSRPTLRRSVWRLDF